MLDGFFAPPPGPISNQVHEGFAKLYELRGLLGTGRVDGASA